MADNFDDYFEYLDVEEEIENRRLNRLPKRYIRDSENPFEFYADTEFRNRYRFNKVVVLNIILPLVDEQLRTTSNRGLPISPATKVLVALRFYATANFQTVCGDLRGISQASVSLLVRTVSILLAEKLQQFIKFPETQNGQRSNILQFHAIAGFPCVAGCIDCTHIKISNPGGDNAEVFRNRKGYVSLNVQVVAGPKLEIMDIVVRHPGSSHDSVIFDRSAVRVRFEEAQVRGVLLGDNGYACRTYLLTPLLNPADQQEQNYNRAHKSTRNLIERVFGVWKRRFPCLQQCLRTKINTSIAIVCATAVLHNIALQYNNDDVEENDIELDLYHVNHAQNEVGLAFRRQFIIQH